MINNKSISISLFAGAFGLDIGIEQAGFHTISVKEIGSYLFDLIQGNKPKGKEFTEQLSLFSL